MELNDTQGYGVDDPSFDAAEKRKRSNAPDNAVFTEGKRAWHGVGMVVEADHLTSEEALRFAGLGGWDLRKFQLEVPVVDDLGNETRIPAPNGKSAIVRMDTMQALGVVGDRYHIVTNEEAFAWCDALVGGEGCHFKTAGSLFGGRKVWIQLEVPFKVTLPDSEYTSFLYLSTSHDGTSAIEVAYWNERIVCSNTLKIAQRGGLGRVSIKHTQTAQSRLAAAQKALGLAQGAADRAQQIAESLYSKKLTRLNADNIIAQLFPINDDSEVNKRHQEEKREQVRDIYNSNEGGQREIIGTAWGLYNSVAAFDDLVVRGSKTDIKRERNFDQLMTKETLADRALAMLGA